MRLVGVDAFCPVRGYEHVSIGLAAVMRYLHFSFYQKYATRISVCVIACRPKEIARIFVESSSTLFFRRRCKGFDYDDESMFFSTTSDTDTCLANCSLDDGLIEYSVPGSVTSGCPGVSACYTVQESFRRSDMF